MNKELILFFITLFLCINVTLSSYGTEQKIYKNLSDVPQSTWNKMATMKIFFGHHSVGSDILQGVNDIIEEHPYINLKIIHTRNIGDRINSPAFVHGNVGRNMDPQSKIDSFKEKIENGYGQDADIAFFKFCFIDFNPETDVEKLFQNYKEMINTLIKEFPKTTFVLVTTPLTCYAPGPSGWIKRTKDFIKKIIKKTNMYDHSSANIFNKLLIQEYDGRLPIFDLAKFESTKSDGSRVYYKKNKNIYYELVQDYTTDGGHLNKTGRRIIANEFLLFLAGVVEQH